MRSSGQPTDPVTVKGLVRRSEDPGRFVPANEPDAGNWFYISVAEIAAAAGLPPDTPLVEVVTDDAAPRLTHKGGPSSAMDVLGGRGLRGKPADEFPIEKSLGDMQNFSVMPRDHMNYAATWFTLSGATGLLAIKVLRQAAKA